MNIIQLPKDLLLFLDSILAIEDMLHVRMTCTDLHNFLSFKEFCKRRVREVLGQTFDADLFWENVKPWFRFFKTYEITLERFRATENEVLLYSDIYKPYLTNEVSIIHDRKENIYKLCSFKGIVPNAGTSPYGIQTFKLAKEFGKYESCFLTKHSDIELLHNFVMLGAKLTNDQKQTIECYLLEKDSSDSSLVQILGNSEIQQNSTGKQSEKSNLKNNIITSSSLGTVFSFKLTDYDFYPKKIKFDDYIVMYYLNSF